MKAAICTKYGPPAVLRTKEVPKPVPKDDEVSIKIRATAVTASDIYIRGSRIPLRIWVPMRLALGLTKPRQPIIGLVLAGEIESAGKHIKRFRAGDRVYGLTGFGLGAYAQYKCMKETDSMRGCLARMPSNISYEEATAAAYGGLLALQCAERGNLRSGQKAIVYGASGTSGTIAVQLAKHYGTEVTAVCGTRNLEFVKSLGADHAVDYLSNETAALADRYDLMIDTAGKAKSSAVKERCKKALGPHGIYRSIDDGKLELDSERLARVSKLIETGAIRPVVDRVFSLDNIAEAHEYVEKGHKRGGVAVSVEHAD